MHRALVPLTMGLLVVACATDREHPARFKLTGREWVVDDIAGRGVIDDSHLTINFGSNGQLSGSGGCNRLIGGYTLRGSGLTITRPGTTMMACPPALMEQEGRFLDVLGKVKRYRIDRSGALVLTSSDSRTVTAR